MTDHNDIEIENLRLANQQAAEYGLELLNANNQLEIQYEELENRYRLVRSELEELKSEFKNAQINKHEEILKGKTNEESLLNEKQISEEYLINEIKSYEQELRTLKQDNESLSIENKNMFANSQELYEKLQELDELNQKLKYDLKESKNQERLLIDDNTELIEQNILLQQQVEKLGKDLINYDKLNVENKKLQENVRLKI